MARLASVSTTAMEDKPFDRLEVQGGDVSRRNADCSQTGVRDGSQQGRSLEDFAELHYRPAVAVPPHGTTLHL